MCSVKNFIQETLSASMADPVFQRVDADPRWGVNLLFGIIFFFFCRKLHENDYEKMGLREGIRPWRPLDPPMGNLIV